MSGKLKISYLERLSVDSDRQFVFKLPIRQKGFDPRLYLVYGGDSNKPLSDFLSNEQAKIIKDKDYKSDPVENGLTILSRYIIVGWDDIFDDDKELIPFSEENCREYLQGLPARIIQSITKSASNRNNFLDKYENILDDQEKNLSSESSKDSSLKGDSQKVRGQS